jgi:hypothetical protein
MNHFSHLDSVRQEMSDPFPSGRMTPVELGDHLARLVWESFSDYLMDPDTLSILARLGVPLEEGLPPERVTEELLIFHMWVHSRAVQLSFFRRTPDEEVRKILDRMHGAIFEDMVANGTPKPRIPVFEQRVSARYSEYYTAAEVSDDRVGTTALEHVVGERRPRSAAPARRLTERAVELATPLRDFLDGVDLAL